MPILESGSWYGTKDALTDLSYELGKLGVDRNTQLSNRTHEDEVSHEPAATEPCWIWTPGGKLERRRLSFLVAERNKAMVMLKELAYRTNKPPRPFDNVFYGRMMLFSMYRSIISPKWEPY